jgi:PAS domain-containing protein
VRAHGGNLSVQRMPEGGTALEVIVPLPGARPLIGEGADSMRSTAAAPEQDSRFDLLNPESMRGEGGDADALSRLLRRSASQTAQDVIDALEGNVAVLDRDGVIRLVNRAWNDFGERNGTSGAHWIGPGVNYLEVCRSSALADESARPISQGLNEVFEGRLATFSCEYPCHSPDKRRWFRMHVTPMPSGDVLVTHFEVAGADISLRGLAH